MSTQVVGSKEWETHFGDIDRVCFLCAEGFAKSEQVVHWMGAGRPQLKRLPFTPNGPQELKVMDALLKRGMSPALHIFFHADCVPTFCRRILEDFDRVKGRIKQ